MASSRGGKKMWCIADIDATYVARMEDILRVYAETADANEPVVCLDERPVVLHGDARARAPMRPGRVARYDYEYVRHGTANIFCIVAPKQGRHFSYATQNRKRPAFANAIARIAKRYPKAKRIHLVMDNLNTHNEQSLIQTYGPTRGRALWRRFVVHYTPKHASWLNMAELEASHISRRCLGTRRIDSFDTLYREVDTYNRYTDENRVKINWSFRVSDARKKFRYNGLITPVSRH